MGMLTKQCLNSYLGKEAKTMMLFNKDLTTSSLEPATPYFWLAILMGPHIPEARNTNAILH